MKIAILGWGSLIWEPRDMTLAGNWQSGGPALPIEFSRVSSDGRLTLVIDETNGVPVKTLYALSGCVSVTDAVAELANREGTTTKHIGVIVVRTSAEGSNSAGSKQIRAWAETAGLDAAIWTALPSNFKEKTGEPFSIRNALHKLLSLAPEKKAKALEYINKAPDVVDTPFRRAFKAATLAQ